MRKTLRGLIAKRRQGLPRPSHGPRDNKPLTHTPNILGSRGVPWYGPIFEDPLHRFCHVPVKPGGLPKISGSIVGLRNRALQRQDYHICVWSNPKRSSGPTSCVGPCMDALWKRCMEAWVGVVGWMGYAVEGRRSWVDGLGDQYNPTI